MPLVPWHEREEYRRKWARETLARIGFGLARDESGFYRPAVRPVPADLPARGKRRRGELLEFHGQLKLAFGPEGPRGSQSK